MTKQALLDRLTPFKQQHLLQFWDDLSDEERVELARTVDAIDLPRVVEIFEKYSTPSTYDASQITPLDSTHHGCASAFDVDALRTLFDDGVGHIARGEVAVVLLAGGQATRLGSAMPKATLPLNVQRPLKSLLGLYVAQIAKLQTLALAANPNSKPIIPLLIMTSPSTYEATLAHLIDDVLPLVPSVSIDQITIFQQSTLPCYDNAGAIIMASKTTIARAPDGNGGLYSSLAPHMAKLTAAGVKHVHAFCIDNILARLADPHFVAFAARNGADCAAKVVLKTESTEAVGVVCCVSGIPQVVEYSELSDDLANQRDADDSTKLALRAGNIANHYFSIAFLQSACDNAPSLEFHVAKKKIPFVDGDGVRQTPKAPNGVKMEQFVFDVFKQSNNFYVWEVPREQEFAPLKNPDSVGKDCPSTSVTAMRRLHGRWAIAAGAQIDGDDAELEIDPSVTYAGEGLEAKMKGKTYATGAYIN